MDFLPTFAHIAGVGLADRRIDGHNIWPLMSGQTDESPYEAFYYYRDARLQAVRSGKWKLHVYRPAWGRENYDGPKEPMLFNLDEDPGEQNDVAEEHPDVVERLQKLANQARQDLGDAVHGVEGANVRPAGEL
jgi:arylsulfatase A-like enzyme